ncbi:MAG TPA: hypothetical protein PLA59_09995 [Myxococcota bacterium]|nr:hypothetical protein [Myxococcota bacterium]HOS62723.1 hypothetical protein [Myxococcota bacterium]HPC92822.1 hypothetical protein [Myxococcota bacterium]HPL25861.1 hypothetical protein [Myxococcota bacterium]HQE74254.1 hypothetical protein [Myxococcota bacterium]
MTAKEKKDYRKDLEDMRKFAKRVSGDKKESLRILHEAGIYTAKGKLSKIYK